MSSQSSSAPDIRGLIFQQMSRVNSLHEILEDRLPTEPYTQTPSPSLEGLPNPNLLLELTKSYKDLIPPLRTYFTELGRSLKTAGGPNEWSSWLKPYRASMVLGSILLNNAQIGSIAQVTPDLTITVPDIEQSLRGLLTQKISIDSGLDGERYWPNRNFLLSEIDRLEGRDTFPPGLELPPSYTSEYPQSAPGDATYEELIDLVNRVTGGSIEAESPKMLQALRCTFPSSIRLAMSLQKILMPTDRLYGGTNAQGFEQVVAQAVEFLESGTIALAAAEEHLKTIPITNATYRKSVEEVIGVGSQVNAVLKDYLDETSRL